MPNRKRVSRLQLLLSISAVVMLASAPQAAADDVRQTVAEKLEHAHHPARLIVRFKVDATPSAKQAAHRTAKIVQVLKSYRHVRNLYLVEVAPPQLAETLTSYLTNPDVAYAEPDYTVHAVEIPNDPDFDLLWGLHNTGQAIGVPGVPGADIRAVNAWDTWTGDPEFRIAIIDTGINYLHPDLIDNIWTNPGEIPDNGIDDDGNGWVDDVHGYDFVNADGDPFADNQHGSHVSGTIGGTGNDGIGVVGVNWACRLVGLKFLGADGSGSTSGAMSAMEYVIANGIRVSNNSWGGGGSSQAMKELIEASQSIGHIFVAAAGNDGRNNDQTPSYPASYDVPNLISVAATTNTDTRAGFSNYGLESVDLGAPGHRIYSTVGGDGHAFYSGTSMATPHVTGVVALVMSRFPELPWTGVMDRIMQSVRPVPALSGITVTGGVVNAASALGDCNGNGVADDDEIADGNAQDCNGNGAPDECDINGFSSVDCNGNTVPDECDIAEGTSTDTLPPDGDGVPDDCQAVFYVPTDETPTIQSAIDAAGHRDFVIVRDGVYRGDGNKDLDPGGKAITIQSENGPQHCVIDAERNGRGFFLHSQETALTRIVGFSIVNGEANRGGAIACFGSSPTVTGCWIVDNRVPPGVNGGGIFCDRGSNPLIENCTLTANQATLGGAVYCSLDSNARIVNSTIAGNVASSFGGGVVSALESRVAIINSTLTGNSGGQSGGAVASAVSDLSVVNSVLWDNTAITNAQIHLLGAFSGPASVAVAFSDVAGGADGVNLDAFSTLDWQEGNIGSDLVGDDPLFSGGPAGTWSNDVTAQSVSSATTLRDENAAWEAGSLAGKLLNPDLSQPLMFPVMNNTATSVTVRGNIAGIAIPGGDYGFFDLHILSSSPCIDAGSGTAVTAASRDMDGQARPFAGGVDMGADEFVSRIVVSDPPDGAIDARQPSEPDGSSPAGWDSIRITFDRLFAGFLPTPSDFVVTQAGEGSNPPEVLDILLGRGQDADSVTVVLSDRIEPGARLCVTHQPSLSRTCLGYLPADANGDGLAGPADILALIDALNGVGSQRPVWSMDIDRSGEAQANDILRLIDLLNGRESYRAWFNRALPNGE